MKLANLVPDSNLLEQIEGVEAGLRKIQKIGRVGQYGFLFTAVLQIVFGLFESGVLAAPPPGSAAARALTGIKIASLVVLPLFLLLFTWSKFWLRQSREPFRYTCSIEPITPLPHSPKLRESAWLANDLEELLSQRIDRIRFVKSDAAAAGLKDESHIDIGGTYVVRARDDEDKTLVLEIMPNVGIGRGKARKLAYPVSYPPDPTPLNRLRRKDDEEGDIELKHSEYKALLERVYSSVATEIYQQIQTDVAGKIELMPTKFLRALALFHEAEDYASSNTLHGYAEAGRLYNASAHLFDPCLKPLPVSALRRFFAKLTRRLVSLARGVKIRCAPVRLGFARREIMCARALTGYVNMLLYERILATISGQKINPAYEAQRAAQDALARFDLLPPDAPGCREALFDAHVSLALSYYYLNKREEAQKELDTARSMDPTRDRDIRFQMVRSVLAPREKQAFRNLLNLAPRWETAQWLVAYEAERQWRARAAFETSLAEIPIREYQNVIDINPGNVGAWANCGYMLWLLERSEEAKGSFRAGRDYKLIKQATFVAELDYGLARIAAEQGELQHAYCYQETAVSDLIAPTRSDLGDFRSYHFELAGDAVLDRFERYRADVEKHLADAGKTKDLSSRILNSVYAFVLTDYGECCQAHHLRTADARSLHRAEQAFELANLFDPENPLALYNLRQLRVRDLPTPGQKTEAELEKEIAAVEAQIAELKKEQELAAAHAQVTAAQNEKEKATAKARIEELGKDQATTTVQPQTHSPQQEARIRSRADLGGTQRGPADRMDALQQEINSARESIRQSQEQIDNIRQQTIEAKLYDQRIRELHPYWTVGMLFEIEMNALEAFIARRDALREEKAAADGKSPSALAAEDRRKRYIDDAISLEKKVTQNIRALLPHDWLWTTKDDFNWNAVRDHDPLNERRWERQFNDIHTSALATYVFTLLLSSSDNKNVLSLLDHIRQTFAWEDIRIVKRLRDLSKEGSRPTHTKYDQKLRMITEGWCTQDPYSFAVLWSVADNPFTDHERMKIFLDATRRLDLSGSLYRWLGEEQLLGIARRTKRKRKLLEPVVKKILQLSDAASSEAARLPELADTSPSSNGTPAAHLADALKVVDEIQSEEFEGNGIDNDEIKRLEKQVERILKDLDVTLNSVRAAKGFGTRLADRKTWHETLPFQRLQLEKLLERYREMEKQCGDGALTALTRAVTASNDPASLWKIGAQLARFGLFEPALEASTRAAQIDAKRPEVEVDREKLNEAVRTLLSAASADYSTKFNEFLTLYRQPPARSRTPGKYLRRRCALLAMLGRCDAGAQPFLDLKQSEKKWRAAIAAEIGELAAGDELDREAAGRLFTGRVAFHKWLSEELRIHKADSAEVVDCRIAEITLARDERRDLRDGMPIIPGAKSFNFLPAVTPLAIEFETNLLGGDDSASTRTLTKTLFPKMQDRIREDTGVRIPGVRMRSNDMDMPPNEYLIMVNEIPLVMGTAYPGQVFVQGAPSQRSTASWYSYGTQRFTHAREGEWREEKISDRWQDRTDVWDHLEYITRHVEHIARLYLVQFFGVQEVYNTLGEWLETGLPGDVAQHIRDIRDDQRLLRRTSRQLRGLLDDRVPLTQPERVATGLKALHLIEDPVECRRVLRDSVREQLWGNDGEYKHFKLSDSITAILDAKSSPGERLKISRDDLQEFFTALRTDLGSTGPQPAIVTRGERLRYLVRYLIREEWPEVPVLADYELLKPLTYDNLPVISLE